MSCWLVGWLAVYLSVRLPLSICHGPLFMHMESRTSNSPSWQSQKKRRETKYGKHNQKLYSESGSCGVVVEIHVHVVCVTVTVICVIFKNL